jgi:hypothetical protein
MLEAMAFVRTRRKDELDGVLDSLYHAVAALTYYAIRGDRVHDDDDDQAWTAFQRISRRLYESRRVRRRSPQLVAAATYAREKAKLDRTLEVLGLYARQGRQQWRKTDCGTQARVALRGLFDSDPTLLADGYGPCACSQTRKDPSDQQNL